MTPIELRNTDDEILLLVSAQKTIAQRDVRVAVPVTALVSTAGTNQSDLEQRIRAALTRFIAADWAFSLVERLGEAVGFERVSLTAWGRVPHAQIYNLAQRARDASAEGLSLGEPEVDYSLPFATLIQAAHDLRGEIVVQVNAQLPDYELWTGRSWRIGSIRFGAAADPARRRTGKGMYRDDDLDDGDAVGGAGGASGRGVTGAERISLRAEVVLRAARPLTGRGVN
jgi:hypothetical protein